MSIVWVVVSLLCLELGATPPVTELSLPEPPLEHGVYALVVGVSGYSPDSLAKAAPSAARFAGALRRTYPSAHITILGDFEGADGPPTQGEVRTYLNSVVPELPRGSVFVFYFAGHGVRRGYSSGAAGSFLRLVANSGPDDYFGSSIPVNEVLDVIAHTPRVNAMVMLDCCYSGPSSVIEKERVSKGLDARAFVLALRVAGSTPLVSTKAIVWRIGGSRRLPSSAQCWWRSPGH